MGQAMEAVIQKDQVVAAACPDNLRTIAQMIPYLQERKASADKYASGRYNKEACDLFFQHIEFCNKKLASILGITIEQS